jgi:hypothetical protein
VGVPVLPPEPSLTVAVIVTDCPNTAEDAEEVTLVDVFALFTVCVVVLVLMLKLESPEYVTCTFTVPVGKPAVVKVAEPLLSVCALPMLVYVLPSVL